MPTVIKEHNFGRMTRKPEYDQYLDGSIYQWSKDEIEELSKGVDTLRSGLYSAASRNGKSIRTQILQDGSFVAQAYEKEE